MLTHSKLKELLIYCPLTGNFTWVKSKKIAGSKWLGYLTIEIEGKKYKAAKLAWFYMTGKWTLKQIDHVNNVKGDNRWCNLREATASENLCNRRLFKNNQSGFKGVCYIERINKWQAEIQIKKVRHYLGVFETADLASKARNAAAIKLHGQFCNF